MFGIDLGITVSSITCTNERNEIVDNFIIFGDVTNKDSWQRVLDMTEHIVDSIHNLCKAKIGVYIEPLVSIEEPVFSYRVRNYISYFNLSCLYALTRNKLSTRGFTIYSINPQTAKYYAKQVVGNKRLSEKLANRGRLTKKGMIYAFKKLVGHEPNYSNQIGRETLADSFFIAKAGIEKRRIELNVGSKRSNTKASLQADEDEVS